MGPSATSSVVYTGAIKSITYTVPSQSRPGERRVVRVNPLTRRPMSCDCPAGHYRRTCRHRQAVEAGMAGKPHVVYGPVIARVALDHAAAAAQARRVTDLYGE